MLQTRGSLLRVMRMALGIFTPPVENPHASFSVRATSHMAGTPVADLFFGPGSTLSPVTEGQ